MNSFSNLKRDSGFERLQKEGEQLSSNQKTYEKDDVRVWNPTVDKAGNGMAVIRFLPAPSVDGEQGLPWVRFFKHGFQAAGGWLIDNCPTSLGGKCPVCESNTILWNSGVEQNKKIARDRKRKLIYIANILVVSDPANPTNEGQVKLFYFGKSIFDKLNEAMNPDPNFDDEKPMNPFDFWKGANFKLKIRNVDDYRNYDKSSFEEPSELFGGDDAKLEALWKSEFSLSELVDPSKFNSYDKIKERLDKVLGGTAEPQTKAADSVLSKYREPTSNAPISGGLAPEDNDDMNFFSSLANE